MKKIPYGRQYIDKTDIAEVAKVLKSEWLTQGPKITEFEKCIARYCGAKYAVAVSSGTAALHIACLAAGLTKGDEAITSPITFVASANCILYCGGMPVFADIQSATGCIDPSQILKNIRRNTRAVIPVHFAGHPCDLKEIYKIARKHKMLVIEDAAHALGSRYNDSNIGSCEYSDMTILSFHPVKAITTGEGGAVLTNRRDLYEKLLILRNHGITKDSSKWVKKGMSTRPWYYEMIELGFNYRISDIQAALGLSQLKKIDSFVQKRREIASLYNSAFRSNPYFDTPVEEYFSESSYHLYTIRLKDRFVKSKPRIFQMLHRKGVGVQVHYIPVYLQPYYRKIGFRPGLCPKSETFYNKEISIPIYPALKKSETAFITETIIKTFKETEKCQKR